MRPVRTGSTCKHTPMTYGTVHRRTAERHTEKTAICTRTAPATSACRRHAPPASRGSSAGAARGPCRGPAGPGPAPPSATMPTWCRRTAGRPPRASPPGSRRGRRAPPRRPGPAAPRGEEGRSGRRGAWRGWPSRPGRRDSGAEPSQTTWWAGDGTWSHVPGSARAAGLPPGGGRRGRRPGRPVGHDLAGPWVDVPDQPAPAVARLLPLWVPPRLGLARARGARAPVGLPHRGHASPPRRQGTASCTM